MGGLDPLVNASGITGGCSETESVHSPFDWPSLSNLGAKILPVIVTVHMDQA